MRVTKLLIFMSFLLELLICPIVILANETSNTPSEQDKQNQPLESTNEEEGIPIDIKPLFLTTGTKSLKAGYSAIFENFQDFKDFYISVKSSSGTKKTEISENFFSLIEQIDFNREVMVVVVGPLIDDTCKNSTIGGLKRFNSDHIQVTVETFWEKSCEHHPGKFPNALLGTVIDRPVKQINVVFKNRIISLPELENKIR